MLTLEKIDPNPIWLVIMAFPLNLRENFIQLISETKRTKNFPVEEQNYRMSTWLFWYFRSCS